MQICLQKVESPPVLPDRKSFPKLERAFPKIPSRPWARAVARGQWAKIQHHREWDEEDWRWETFLPKYRTWHSFSSRWLPEGTLCFGKPQRLWAIRGNWIRWRLPSTLSDFSGTTEAIFEVPSFLCLSCCLFILFLGGEFFPFLILISWFNHILTTVGSLVSRTPSFVVLTFWWQDWQLTEVFEEVPRTMNKACLHVHVRGAPGSSEDSRSVHGRHYKAAQDRRKNVKATWRKNCTT